MPRSVSHAVQKKLRKSYGFRLKMRLKDHYICSLINSSKVDAKLESSRPNDEPKNKHLILRQSQGFTNFQKK